MARLLLLLAGTLAIVPLWTDSVWSQDTDGTPPAAAAETPTAERLADSPHHNEGEQAKPSEKPSTEVPPADAPQKSSRHAKGGLAKNHASGAHHAALGAEPLHAGDRAILKALDEPASIELTEKPLTALVDHIRQQHHIPVQIDKRALIDIGVDSDAPITAAVSQIPLHDALDLILQDLQLTWIIKSGVLLITTQEEEESHLIATCYDIADIRAAAPDRPYKNSLPTCRESKPNAVEFTANCPYPIAASLSKNGIGGMSEGLALATTTDSSTDIGSMIEMITATIEPTSWDRVGGHGNIAPFDNLLVINQTLRIHGKIEALLADIREKRASENTLVVELHWLWLDTSQHEQLLGNAKLATVGRASLAVNAKTLEHLARKAPGFRGQIACSNGQLVHLASGDRHSIISSTIPVIGSGVAYQPVIEVPNAGVVLELRASAMPGVEAAILDVQSTVTRLNKVRPPARVGASWPPYETSEGSANEGGNQETIDQPGGSASAPVDQPIMPAQQFATTVRVPLGNPVILGAMTFSPTEAAGLAEATENPTQLYLIATTRIATLATEEESKKP
jgi:hypothetical protein